MLRTIAFYSWFWITLVLSTPLCVVFLALRGLGLGNATGACFARFLGAWARSCVAVSGSTIEATGLERIPAEKRLCFVANHQGDFDIISMLALLKRQVGFISKRAGLYVPIMNIWLGAMGSVFIDRKDVRKGLKSIDRGIRLIRKGQALAIFPEGTRSRSPAIGPFRNGSFRLPVRAGAVIVPVTIDGTWRIWEERRRIVPGRIAFTVHEPIPTEGLDAEQRKALPDRVRAIIAGALRSG
ncbi:MAG: 1-acyl-sn-glycerol-3-phosphate acyltransferase [Spirochaetes bacterium]|nr:1-acyl-sn-glycerol-3-phosphate acyltransferase [Spirochaetota bacterium]MBU1079530.1 1-acyl-sn-glycerol-3-phosphate acyltransferase [Spirochaetota bacterium]